MMQERHLLLKELNLFMRHCRNSLAKFASLIASKRSYFDDLVDYIELAEDSEFKEYAANLKRDIDGILSSSLPMAIHIYAEVQIIATLLRNVNSLSNGQLRLLRKQVVTLIGFLAESFQTTYNGCKYGKLSFS